MEAVAGMEAMGGIDSDVSLDESPRSRRTAATQSIKSSSRPRPISQRVTGVEATAMNDLSLSVAGESEEPEHRMQGRGRRRWMGVLVVLVMGGGVAYALWHSSALRQAMEPAAAPVASPQPPKTTPPPVERPGSKAVITPITADAGATAEERGKQDDRRKPGKDRREPTRPGAWTIIKNAPPPPANELPIPTVPPPNTEPPPTPAPPPTQEEPPKPQEPAPTPPPPTQEEPPKPQEPAPTPPATEPAPAAPSN
jgi:hypothetical protein